MLLHPTSRQQGLQMFEACGHMARGKALFRELVPKLSTRTWDGVQSKSWVPHGFFPRLKVVKKLLYALVRNLSEAVLGKQILVLENKILQPCPTLQAESRLTQWQHTQKPGCSRPAHLGAKLDHTLQQPLYSVAVGILNVTTKLDEGIHFLVSCFPGSKKLLSFETRSKLEE